MSDINECENLEICSSSYTGEQALRCVNIDGSYFCAKIINKPHIKMIIIGMSFYS